MRMGGGVRELQLEDHEIELLRDVLDSAYRDLRYEIADTSVSGYKQQLKDRESAMRTLLDKVGGPRPDLA
jgi:hypothetical protein